MVQEPHGADTSQTHRTDEEGAQRSNRAAFRNDSTSTPRHRFILDAIRAHIHEALARRGREGELLGPGLLAMMAVCPLFLVSFALGPPLAATLRWLRATDVVRIRSMPHEIPIQICLGLAGAAVICAIWYCNCMMIAHCSLCGPRSASRWSWAIPTSAVPLACTLWAATLLGVAFADGNGTIAAWASALFVAAPLLGIPIVLGHRRLERVLRNNAHRYHICFECGYRLTRIESPCCPECGTATGSSRGDIEGTAGCTEGDRT